MDQAAWRSLFEDMAGQCLNGICAMAVSTISQPLQTFLVFFVSLVVPISFILLHLVPAFLRLGVVVRAPQEVPSVATNSRLDSLSYKARTEIRFALAMSFSVPP